MEAFDSLIKSASELTSSCVLMSSAVEEVTAEPVARHGAYRAEREFDEPLLLILTEESAHKHPVYLERHIDKALGITLLEFELTQFLIGKSDERGGTVREDLHFLIQHKALKTQAELRVVVIYTTVYFILVNSLVKQMGYDLEEIAVIAVV